MMGTFVTAAPTIGGACKRCRYWTWPISYNHPPQDTEEMGRCRRYPPIPYIREGGDLDTIWPETRGHEGCGEWQERLR